MQTNLLATVGILVDEQLVERINKILGILYRLSRYMRLFFEYKKIMNIKPIGIAKIKQNIE